MRALLVAIAVALAGCQYIIDIPDRELGSPVDAGGGDGGDGDIDAGLVGPCNPITQEGCDAGEKCTSVNGATSCETNGTVSQGDFCFPDALGPGIDDCSAGLVCDREQTCRPMCGQGVGCSIDQSQPRTCQVLDDTFTDQSGLVGVCQLRCDPTMFDCPYDQSACYLNVGVGEAQCLEEPAAGSAPIAFEMCLRDATGCFANGCTGGFGPHYSDSAGGSINKCTEYCIPNEVHMGTANPDLAMGGNGDATGGNPGVCGGLGGTNLGEVQCRFIKTALDEVDILDIYGMCVITDSNNWGDCTTDCDIGDPAGCPPGCLKSQ